MLKKIFLAPLNPVVAHNWPPRLHRSGLGHVKPPVRNMKIEVMCVPTSIIGGPTIRHRPRGPPLPEEKSLSTHAKK